MLNELPSLVSVDLTVPALVDVQSMRRSELSMRLQLLLPATASAVPVLERGKETSLSRKGKLVCSRYSQPNTRTTSKFEARSQKTVDGDEVYGAGSEIICGFEKTSKNALWQ